MRYPGFRNRLCCRSISRSRLIVGLILGLLLVNVRHGFAEDKEIEIRPIASYRLKVVVEISAEASRKNLTRLRITTPIPCNWREQDVKLLEESRPRGWKSREEKVAGMGRLWVLSGPRLNAGASARFERTYSIKRFEVITKLSGRELLRPNKPSREARAALGASPGMEIRDEALVSLASKIEKENEAPWKYAQAAANWVRENVEYQQGPYQGARFALRRKMGDCEDRSALFIALCRISKIPARTVWVEGHAYPEFLLEGQNGAGFWIPVQLHGPEAFGNIEETRPILQKGDRYRDPATRKTIRYLPQQVTAFGGQAQMSVERIVQPSP